MPNRSSNSVNITPPVDVPFSKAVAAPSALAVAGSIDDLVVTADAGHGISANDDVGIFYNDRFYYGKCLSVATNDITLDTPLDYAFPIDSIIIGLNSNLAVDGSTTSQTFKVSSGAAGTLVFDIHRIMFYIQDGTIMDDAKFGGITALTKGLVFRRVDGTTHNVFNVKSNGDLALLAYDTDYHDKAPAGSYGFSTRITFGSDGKHGTIFRLEPGDDLEMIVQDDLTGLDVFKIMAEGKIVNQGN